MVNSDLCFPEKFHGHVCCAIARCQRKDANTVIMQMNIQFAHMLNKAMQIESLLSKLTRIPEAEKR
jgi:hypothetical protein